jgi:hypothetical protein
MLVALALLALPAAAGKIKRYTDDEGTLHIIDSEPAGQAKAPGTSMMAPQAAPRSFPAPVVEPPEVPEPPPEGGTEGAPEEAPAEQEEAPGA